MKSLKRYIQEGFKFGKNKMKKYSCQPKTKLELREILKERLAKDKHADLNDIDVSKIEDMSDLFKYLNPYNIKIDQWDISNCEDMTSMFMDCDRFIGDVSDWNVENVKNMSYMFFGCSHFDPKTIENWNTKSLQYANQMFYRCAANSDREYPSWWIKMYK